MTNNQDNVMGIPTHGILPKLGNFLGINKFGVGLATAGRFLTGGIGKDIEQQNQNIGQVSKILYAAKQENDPLKRRRLLELAKSQGEITTPINQINPGLNLTPQEVLGSAANIGLNIATPSAFRGGKAAILAKNIATGVGFGAASGLEQGRTPVGIAGSAVGGGLIGGAVGGTALLGKALKDFTSVTTPKWLMERAVRPTLDEARKAIKYGEPTLGEKLLKEGVKGGPQKLLKIADEKLNSLESQLQTELNKSSLADTVITREQIAPYLENLTKIKAETPGMQGDVQRIKNIVDTIPDQLSLSQANEMKRRIYNELRDVSYKLDPKLNTKAKTLKIIAKGLKEEIEKAVGGTTVKDINQKLALYGNLEKSITDQLARSLKNNKLGLTDAILIGGGALNNPLNLLINLGLVAGRHFPGGKTYLAQGLTKVGSVGTGRTAQTASGILRRAAFNFPGINQSGKQ